MTHFDTLANADWHGVMALDSDPQQEPLVPPKTIAGPDWRDLAHDAKRSITNAERCDRHGDRRANLLAAQKQLAMAIEDLCK